MVVHLVHEVGLDPAREVQEEQVGPTRGGSLCAPQDPSNAGTQQVHQAHGVHIGGVDWEKLGHAFGADAVVVETEQALTNALGAALKSNRTTIVAARNVGMDGKTGTIAAGRAADLVLVEGDPSRNIGDTRNTRVVMMDGKLMDADELRAASGFSGRSHPAR